MCFLTYRTIIFVVLCMGFLSFHVSASRSMRLLVRSSDILNADHLQETNVPLNVAPSPAMMNFDPNQSEKRMVKGGSDPIHNRC
ncbi:hypothetical protein PHJA_000929400 [Phtheirospermum japonicum]|uniref:Uncharacterized protein n=1 Tax=Phtheirospermum japonicum TaxID=374723 RepID=A0A830BK97_9LAMI|nr:hypothetical protein PHJA_000929400 [Phtheirospermum japonicum]